MYISSDNRRFGACCPHQPAVPARKTAGVGMGTEMARDGAGIETVGIEKSRCETALDGELGITWGHDWALTKNASTAI